MATPLGCYGQQSKVKPSIAIQGTALDYCRPSHTSTADSELSIDNLRMWASVDHYCQNEQSFWMVEPHW